MATIKTNPSGLNYPGIYRNNSGDSTQVGTYHLADNPNLYEVARTNNFDLIITGLNGLVRAGSIGDESNAIINDAQDVIRLSVISFGAPEYSQGTLQVKRGNNSIYFAGVPTYKSGSLTCYDYIGADTYACLQAWQNLAYNPTTEKVGLATDYKKKCTLIEYSPDYQVVRQFILYGCWLTNLKADDFSNDSNNLRKITCNIQIDRFEIDTSSDI